MRPACAGRDTTERGSELLNSLVVFANTGQVPVGVTVVFALLLVGLIACLALEEVLHAKKSVIAAAFAVVCVFLGAALGYLPLDDVAVGSQELLTHSRVEGTFEDSRGEQHTIAIDPVGESNAAHPPQDGQASEEAHGGDPAESSGHSEASSGASATSHHPVHVNGHRIGMPFYVPAIDWSVIAIILGSSLFVDITSKSGLFTWIALKVTKASGGDPLVLLVCYGIMTVLFSAVLNNVTAMIIVGSLTAVSLNRLQRSDKLLGFLLVEGLLTNVGGLLTLISSVPNIIVGSAANISFVRFFYTAGPYVLVTTIVTLFMGARVFKISRLKTEEEKAAAAEQVARFDENDGIESWNFFWFAAAMLVLFILTIATTSVLPVFRELGMGFVAILFASIMLLQFKSRVDEFYRALDWDLIGFFMALFVVIHVMEYTGVLTWIGVALSHVIDWGDTFGTASILIASAGFSSVTDNIPLAAMLSKILGGLGTQVTTSTSPCSPLWWSVILGSNLGGNLTPIGSASTLVAVTIIHRNKLPMSFADFVKIAFPFAVVQIAIATVYVLLFI